MSPRASVVVAVAGALAGPVAAQIASLPFRDCAPNASIAVATVYAQLSRGPRGSFLNFTLLASSAQQVLYNNSNLLSTVFNPTSVLTFVLNSADQSAAFCQSLRPPSPLPNLSPLPPSGFCPLAPGPLAFAVGTQLVRAFELVTLNTQIRVLDTSSPAQELACVQVAATPLRPAFDHAVYGHAVIVFWATVALAIGYWLVVGAARLAAAWKRGRQRVHNDLWSHVQGLGFVFTSAISGERFASSPALIRFGTPSMRDIIFHTQWCTLLGMVAVQWPRFVYPYFAQTAWASLLYNVSLTQGTDSAAKHWHPLHTDPFDPPSDFADQLVDPASPLFLNTSIPNSIFTLPSDISHVGIPALAASVGIRPADAFNNAIAIFVLILAGAVIFSVVILVIDWLFNSLSRVSGRSSSPGTKSPRWSAALKEFGESPEPVLGDDDLGSGNVRFLHRPASRTLQDIPSRTGWLSYRLGQSSFHGSVLHGNLVRILMLFHLPITIFACYQFASGRSHSSLAAVIVAVIAFAVFSVAIPAWLMVRLFTIPTSKLYDETRTLLALGPLYNHYAHGSQLFASLFFAINIAYGVTLGCGQKSGTAQSIIILVVEVASALTTSVWLPWGRGATMGGISFLMCVARIITSVLLVILSPVVAVGDAAGGWIAYAILVIQALIYAGFVMMLIFKILEGLVRLLWDVSFDRSKHTVDTGLIGAIGLTRCCGSRRKNRNKNKGTSTASSRRAQSRPSHAESDSTTQNMLPPAMHAAASHSRTTVSGPPSVLRPEHLNQPYKEDSDDEGGYILGAWHYDDEPPSPPPPPEPPAPAAAPPSPSSSSGFARVAGGRANIESPYTMAVGTGTAFRAGTSAAASASASAGFARGGTEASAPARGASGANLPPGAMAPGHAPHARRKSQSAIIEDAAALAGASPAVRGRVPVPGGTAARRGGGGGNLDGAAEIRYDDEDDDAPHGPRRRNWFGLFASDGGGTGVNARSRGWRRQSRSEAAAPMLPNDDEEPSTSSLPPSSSSPEASTPGGGARTFVVIRERRPSPLSQAQVPDDGQDPDEGSSSRRSFTVVRPNRTGGAANAANSQGPSSAASASPPRPPRSAQRMQTRDAPF